jgi:1,4-alpha-glucan branching enzyme
MSLETEILQKATEKKTARAPEKIPMWYKSGIIYELHVRAFQDSDGDGTGDFRGLTSRLDYLRDLGVTAIWLLPFYPSPLKDDGYDISDYYGVHPMYGTLADFKMFLREAHRSGLRVITELVLNHSSVLNEVRELDRQHRMREGMMKRINANPALKNAYETLVKDLPEDQKEGVIAQIARTARRAVARTQGQHQQRPEGVGV